jgi:predicted kinase
VRDDPQHPFIVLVGAPGSGKSTWARRNFKPTEITSSDALRAQIGDHSGDQRASKFAFRALHAIVAGRAELGQTVVVDATNRTAEQRDEITVHAIRWTRPKFAVVFLTPLDVCLERNARRRTPRRVPEAWLRETHAMIEADFDPATMWMPPGFDGALFVRPDAHGWVGGTLTLRKYAQSGWLDDARQDPPESFNGPEKWPYFHTSAWQR